MSDEKQEPTEQEPVEQQPPVEDVTGLKSALAAERKARKEAEKQAQKYKETQESIERKSLVEKEEYKQLWEADKERLTQLEQKIKDKDIDSALKSVAISITKDGNKRDDIMALYHKYAVYTEEGVTFNYSGIEYTKDELIERIKADRPYLVDGSQASGGGASGGASGSLKPFSELTERERVELYNQSPEKYASRRDAEKK